MIGFKNSKLRHLFRINTKNCFVCAIFKFQNNKTTAGVGKYRRRLQNNTCSLSRALSAFQLSGISSALARFSFYFQPSEKIANLQNTNAQLSTEFNSSSGIKSSKSKNQLNSGQKVTKLSYNCEALINLRSVTRKSFGKTSFSGKFRRFAAQKIKKRRKFCKNQAQDSVEIAWLHKGESISVTFGTSCRLPVIIRAIRVSFGVKNR